MTKGEKHEPRLSGNLVACFDRFVSVEPSRGASLIGERANGGTKEALGLERNKKVNYERWWFIKFALREGIKMSKKKQAAWEVVIMVVALTLFVPGMSIAGSLEPSAAPGSTMKTLEQIPPTWSQKLPGAQRFEPVLDGAAVLDKETGLVWEKSPSVSAHTWVVAIATCRIKEVGGRKGWHLPTIEQLASLVDNSVAGSPKLPAGHPFTGVSAFYWSATTHADDTIYAWGVPFNVGSVVITEKTYNNYVWCVRGGQSYDGQ